MTFRNDDWDAAGDELIAEERRAAGPPPTADEVLAFFENKLPKPDADRVRKLLVAYPEMARLALADVPGPEELEPAELLSDAELSRDWNSIRSRTVATSSGAAVLQFWRSLAVAATIAAVALGGLLVQSKLAEHHLAAELREPRFSPEPQLLLPENTRGGDNAVIELPSHTRDFTLQPALIDQPAFADYRIEITDDDKPPHVIWSGAGIRRRSDDTFVIRVSRTLLDSGTYHLVIYGIDGARNVRLAGYAFHVPEK